MKGSTWKKSGHYEYINDHRIFYHDTGTESTPLMILHGYPSCSYDYHKVINHLANDYRVIVHDQLGFGCSDKPVNYSYSLIDQAKVALALWKKLGIQSGHIIAHDYGTSVLCEILYQANEGNCPVSIISATVGNGSMLIQMANLLLSQKLLMHPLTGPVLARLSSRQYFHYNFRKLWANPDKYERSEIDELWEMLISNGGRKVLPKITGYIKQRYVHFDRWVNLGLYKTSVPVNICWADKDPVAVVDMAYVLNKNIPNSRLSILEDVGHYPMLEAPDLWTNAVLELLNFSE